MLNAKQAVHIKIYVQQSLTFVYCTTSLYGATLMMFTEPVYTVDEAVMNMRPFKCSVFFLSSKVSNY